jgi:hypothetical protein
MALFALYYQIRSPELDPGRFMLLHEEALCKALPLPPHGLKPKPKPLPYTSIPIDHYVLSWRPGSL